MVEMTTEEHFQNILDCMSGTDGGARFMGTKALIVDMDSREDDINAEGIVEIMRKFSRLINIANTDLGEV